MKEPIPPEPPLSIFFLLAAPTAFALGVAFLYINSWQWSVPLAIFILLAGTYGVTRLPTLQGVLQAEDRYRSERAAYARHITLEKQARKEIQEEDEKKLQMRIARKVKLIAKKAESEVRRAESEVRSTSDSAKEAE